MRKKESTFPLTVNKVLNFKKEKYKGDPRQILNFLFMH